MGNVRIPDQVKVGPVTYRIVLASNDEMKKLNGSEDEDVYLLGYHLAPDQAILINKEQGPDMIRVTLVHELMHAVWEMMCLPSDPQLQESCVSSLSVGLVDLLRDNPKLVDVIMDGVGSRRTSTKGSKETERGSKAART